MARRRSARRDVGVVASGPSRRVLRTGPENNRVAFFAPEMTRVLGAGRPVRLTLTTPGSV